jgi:hypothetical protein
MVEKIFSLQLFIAEIWDIDSLAEIAKQQACWIWFAKLYLMKQISK